MHRAVAAGALLLVSFAAVPAQKPVPGKNDVRLVGRIVSVLHEGVPAAEVWVTDVQGNRLGRAVADGDGYYQVGRLPSVQLQVHARGGDKVEGSMPVAASGPVREATLMLEDGELLRGTVVLPDGTAAAGAAVVVTCEAQLAPPFDWWAETTADAKGAWSLPMAPLRPLVVRAFVVGRPIAERTVARDRPDAVQVAIPPGELATRPVKVTGAPAGEAVRVVCDLGADRRRNGYRLPASATETTLDADGTATLWDLKVSYDVRIVAPGWQSMPVCIRCAPDTARDLEFALTAVAVTQLAPSTRMTGRLVDEVGWPLADVTITSRYESDPERIATATSAGDGSFVIDVPVNEKVLCQFGLSSREWRLGHPQAQLDSDGVTRLTVPASALQPLRLAATRAGIVTATLRGPGNLPLAATRVELAPVRGKTAVITATDAAGRLDVGGLPPGSYVLSVGAGAARIGKVAVDVTARDTATVGEIEWAPVGEVRGVVTDGGGNPVPSAMLFAMPWQGKGRVRDALGGHIDDAAVPVLTDRHGRYRIPHTTAGEWVLVPRAGRARAVGPSNAVKVTVEARAVTTADVTIDR